MPDTSTTISVLIDAQVDEGRLTSATEKVGALKDQLISCQTAAHDMGDSESESMFSSMVSTFDNLHNILSNFGADFNKFGNIFSGNISKIFNTVDNSISGFTKSINSITKQLDKGGSVDASTMQSLLTKALSFSEAGGILSRATQLSGKDLGWSKETFATKMPLLMSRLINPEVKRLSETQFLHDTPSLNRYVNSLMGNRAIRKGLNSLSGMEMTDEQARANLEMALLMYNRRASQSFGANEVAKTPFHKASATLYPHDIIPERFRGAYYGMGVSKQKKDAEARDTMMASLPVQGNNYVSRQIYKQLRDYVEGDENGDALHGILKESGIMSIQGGRRHWANSLTLAQASLLGGLSARELYNSKRGYAFYDANPNDPANDYRVDHRMSRRVQAQLALMDILSQDQRITPSTDYDLSQIEKMNSQFVVRPGIGKLDYIRGKRITSTGTPDQFVMPITEIDPKSGKLVYRDPSWQKKTSLFDEGEDDQFAIMTDNPLVKLAKQIGYKGKKTGIAYGHGNGTFGYGRDSTGKAIYDTPPVIKLKASQFFDTDASGFNHTLNPERGKILESIVREQAYKYGDSDYEYAYQGDNAVYMIESGLKKQIDKWYEDRNLPSFFEGLNEGGLESIPEYDKLIKQINGMKKGSSTAQAYEEVFGRLKGRGAKVNRELTDYERKNGYTRDANGFILDQAGENVRDLNTRVANISAWYKALGYLDEDIPDGAAFGDSSVFRNGPLQMRSAVGFGKYVLNPYNLQKLFDMATAGFTKEDLERFNDTNGESYGGNWLFSRGLSGKDQIDVWMPSITATDKDVEALKTGRYRDDTTGREYVLNDDERRQLRQSKFFIANSGDIDQILTDKTAKQYQAFRYLSGKHYANQYLGGDESKLSSLGQVWDSKTGKMVDRFDAKTRLVTLTPEEQGEMHNRATPSYMVMRSAWDYATDPTIMSQQTAAAMGFDESLMKASDTEFEKRIFRLGTAEGRIEALKANPFYKRRLEQNTSFAYSSEANAYIEKQIRALEEAQLAGYVALPQGEGGIKAVNQVAAITPGALIEPVLRAAGLDEDKIAEGVRMLLPSKMDENQMIYTGKELSKGKIMARRNPDAGGQGVEVGSYYSNDKVRDVMHRLGVDDEMANKALWLSQRQMYSLNTGDFDGDTVNAYIGLPEQTLERNRYITAEIKKAEDEYKKAQELQQHDTIKKEQVSVAQARLDALTRYYASTQTMGGASKILREAMNLPDDDPTKWKRVYEGMKLYDFASSDMRTKGLDPTISKMGLETIKGGNSFERFLAHMRKESGKDDEDIREAHLGRDIFKTNLPSYNDPQGVASRLLAGKSLLEGRSDYSNFSASMQKLMDMEYGDAQTPEAKAARWYAKQYEKTAYGRLLTQKDLAAGDQLAYDWLRSMNNRGVKRDDDEYVQYGRFSKRMDFLHSRDAMTYDALSERAAELQAEYQRTGSESIRAKWGMIQQALFNHESFEQDYTNLDKIENKELRRQAKQAAKDAQAISESIEAEEVAEAQAAQRGNYWNSPSITGNWSNFKHWIKKPVKLTGVKQLSSEGAPIDTDVVPIDFYSNPADRVAVASRELFNDQYETEHILIGNIMHKAFENYFKDAGTGNLNGRTIDNYFTDLVTGDSEYARKLKEKGYTIQKTSAEGQPDRYEARGIAGSGLDKLNNLLPTNLNKGVSSIADFLVALDKAGFDVEHPANIEGGFVSYDKDGKYKSFDDSGQYEMKLKVPVRNAEGVIQTDEQGNVLYDETKTTHARPDLMLKKKDSDDLYVVDYKSRFDGAVESLVQSGFYTSVIDRLAKRALTGKDEEGNDLEAAEIKELDAFKQAGYLDTDGNYVSRIKGAIGFDPRTRKSVMIERTGDNTEWFDEGVKLAEEAMSYKMVDAAGLLSGGSAYARAVIDHNRINKRVEDQISGMAERYNATGETRESRMAQAERDFFLSRYQADRDTINNVRSSLYKEMDLPERSFNRFSGYERRLKDALPDEVVKAVMESYTGEDGFVDVNNPVIRELSDEMKEKARMLAQVQNLGMSAAVTDWQKAETDVTKMLTGTKSTAASSMLESVNRRIKQAASSREFLQTRTVTNEKGEEQALFRNYIKDSEGNFKLADSFLSAREQAELFATDSSDTIVKANAARAKKKYLESIEAEEVAMESINAAFKNYRSVDSKEQDADWAKIAGDIKDPVSAFQDGLQNRIDTAQAKINEWNSDIVDWMTKLSKGDVDSSMISEVEALIVDRQNRVANARKDLDSGRIRENYIRDQQRALGLIGGDSPEEKASKWKADRMQAIKVSLDRARAKQFTAEYDPQSTLAERALADREYEEAAAEYKRQYAVISQSGDLYQQIWSAQSQQRIDDFNRQIKGGTITNEQKAQRAVDLARGAALDKANDGRLSEEERKQWEKIALDDDLWSGYREKELNDANRSDAARAPSLASQMLSFNSLMDKAERRAGVPLPVVSAQRTELTQEQIAANNDVAAAQMRVQQAQQELSEAQAAAANTVVPSRRSGVREAYRPEGRLTLDEWNQKQEERSAAQWGLSYEDIADLSQNFEVNRRELRKEFSLGEMRRARKTLNNLQVGDSGIDLQDDAVMQRLAEMSTRDDVVRKVLSDDNWERNGKFRNHAAKAAQQLLAAGLLNEEVASRVSGASIEDLNNNWAGALHGFMTDGKPIGFAKRRDDAIAAANAKYEYKAQSKKKSVRKQAAKERDEAIAKANEDYEKSQQILRENGLIEGEAPQPKKQYKLMNGAGAVARSLNAGRRAEADRIEQAQRQQEASQEDVARREANLQQQQQQLADAQQRQDQANRDAAEQNAQPDTATQKNEIRQAQAKAKAAQQIASMRKTMEELDKIDNLTDVEKAEREKLHNRLDGTNAERTAQVLTDYYDEQLKDAERINEPQKDYSHSQFMRQGDQLRRQRFGGRGIAARALNYRDSAIRQYQQREVEAERRLVEAREARDSISDKNSDEYKAASEKVNQLEQASSDARSSLESLQGPMGVVAGLGNVFGNTMANIATRLGRQMFQKALQETKRFIQEYDKSMTEIQMITQKSDTQIDTLGAGLLNTAKNLKVSFSDVATSASALYRQGLSDSEVNSRLDTILKFSTVSGTKVDAATKLITVAMNTGLVSNADEAADVVTALGDSAATNAAQIEKGIEKAGAAAAADGTSFGELAAMLTAITSTTQVSGNIAGNTLNTIMSRMNKIGTNELIYDENGKAISGSDVSNLLKAQGIRTYDENGNKRSTFDVLRDLSENWSGMSDAEQSQIATAIAGTRMYSNFSAIMQGLQEGDIDQYLDLVGSSEGIVNQKYSSYEKSLAASQKNMQASFDKMIANSVGKINFSGFYDALSGIFNFLTLGDSEAVRRAERLSERLSVQSTYMSNKYSDVDRLQVLKNKENRTSDEEKEYQSLISNLGERFNVDLSGLATSISDVGSAASDASSSVTSVSAALDSVAVSADEAAQRIIDEAKDQKIEDAFANMRENLIDDVADLENSAAERKDSDYGSKHNATNPMFSSILSFDEETGKYSPTADGAQKLISVLNGSVENDDWFGYGGWSKSLNNSLFGTDFITDFTYNQDLASWLPDLFMYAALEDRRNDNGPQYYKDAAPQWLVGGKTNIDDYTREDWSNLIKSGQISESYALGLLNYVSNITTAKASVSEGMEADIKEKLTENLSEVYSADEIDAISQALVKEATSEGLTAGEVYSRFVALPSSAKRKKINEITQERNASKTDKEKFKAMGLKDVGDSGYYLGGNGERYTREDLLGLYDSDVDTNAARLLSDKFDISAFSKEDQNRIQHLRRAGVQYKYLSADDQAFLRGFFPSEVNSKNYTAVDGTGINNSAFKEKNAVGLAADELIGIMQTQGFEDFDSFYNFVKTPGNFAGWSDIEETLANVMSQAKLDANDKWVGPANLMDQITDVLYANSYSFGARTKTAKQTGELALEAYTGLQNGELYLSSDEKDRALAAAAGNDELIAQINQRGVISDAQKAALQGVISSDLYTKVANGEKLTDEEDAYIRGKIANAGLGLTKYTDRQSAANIASVREWAASETGISNIRDEILTDYLSGFNGADEWLALTRAKERNEEYDAARLAELDEDLVEYQQRLLGNAAASASKLYSGTALAEAQGRMLLKEGEENRLSYDTTTEQDLYEAAYSQLGEQGKEYLRMLSDTNATQEEIEAQRQLALKENARALKTAEEADALKNAELQGGVAYAKELYRQNNKTGLAANDLYSAITAENVKDWAAFANVLDSDKAQSWHDLVEAFPELTDSFEDLGLKFKDDGTLDVDAINTAGLNLADVIGQIAALIGEKSLDFQDDQYNTRSEVYDLAQQYVGGTKSDAGKKAIEEIVGADMARRYTSTDYALTSGEYGEQAYFDMLMENYRNGIAGLTDLQAYNGANALYEAAMSGTYSTSWLNTSSDMLGAYSGSVEGLSQFLNMATVLEDQKLKAGDFKGAEKGSAAYEQLSKAFEGTQYTADQFLESMESVDAEMAEAGVKATRKYRDNTDAVSSSFANLTKNTKTQNAELKRMTGTLSSVSNNQFYRNRYKSGDRGSETMNAIAGQLGTDIKGLKLMSEETIKARLEKLEIEDVEAVQTDADAVGEAISQELTTALGEGEPIVIQGQPLTVESGPVSMDFGTAESELSGYLSEATANFLAMLQAWGVNGQVVVEQNGDSISARIEVSDLGTGSKGGGGGGGGGGKSALDKMLEDHKHKISEIEHLIKMNEIDETKFERMNQYDAYLGSLDKELGLQERLAAQYRENIDELQKLIGGLAKGSEDYNKAMESLWGYQEALAAISNTIDEVNAKRISITSTRQENEDKPGTHKANLWDAKAEGYQIRGQFENYAVSRQGRIDEYQNQIEQNSKQIEEWEKLLPSFVENSKDWLEIRDNIWSIQEENASLANEMQQAIYDLNSARIDQWNTDLNNRLAPREHEMNMLSTYGELFQNNRQYEDYRNTLGQQNDITQSQVALYEEYLAKLKDEIKTLPEGTDAWYSARESIFSYEEALAQATATMDENNRQIEQSKIDELTKQYTDVNDDLSHTMNMLKAQQDRFDKDNNFTMYLEAVNAQADVTRTQIKNLEEQLAGYIDLASEITEDTDQWDSVQQSVRSTAEELENAKNNLAELERLSQQSEFEHLQEVFQRQDDLDQHNIKMAQYQETLYQNRGELTNYGTMLMIENELRQARAQNLAEYIEQLNAQIEAAEEGSDTYYKLIDALYKAEEQYESETNAIDKNTEAYKKNQEAILKTRQTLVNTIDTEIKTRVKEQREMLSAEVSIQNQILGVIRKRYQAEFALVRADIQNKKKALQEEKSLINERLNARLQAEQDESKQEELSEMKRQLSLIASDPTRTKDARELQKRIDEIEKEMADQAAKDEAQAMIDQLEDESKAYDEYMTYQEEKLNEMLKDANSTALYEELNAVMGSEDMTREDRFASYMAWLEKNSEDYKYATDAARLQMEQSNLDSWNKMLGFVDTYWDEVERIIGGGVDGILDYMKDSSSWRWASDVGRELLEINWKNIYEAFEDAYRDDAEWDHGHDWTLEFEDEIGELNYGIHDLTGIAKELYDLYLSDIRYDYIRPTDVDDDAGKIDYNDYAGIGKKEEKLASAISGSSSGGSGGAAGNPNPPKTENKPTRYTITQSGGEYVVTTNSNGEYIKYSDAQVVANQLNSEHKRKLAAIEAARKAVAQERNAEKRNSISEYASGGLVNYTGLAWVDGTKSKPEAFLSAVDTQNIGALMDYLSYVDISGLITHVPGYFGNGESNSYGDINIVINQAELKSDADYDEVARQVGKAVVRQLSRDGLHMNGYSL